MFKKINSQDIVLDRSFQGLCLKPFYGHTHGCPNYGKKAGCPPSKFLENEILDFNRDMFVIYTPFNVSNFARRMAERHPDWLKSPRQLCNPRQWQPTARKMHRNDISDFLQEYPNLYLDNSPEAKGVNVSVLMKTIGIDLNWEWPPKEIYNLNGEKDASVYVVSLAGYLVNSCKK